MPVTYFVPRGDNKGLRATYRESALVCVALRKMQPNDAKHSSAPVGEAQPVRLPALGMEVCLPFESRSYAKEEALSKVIN